MKMSLLKNRPEGVTPDEFTKMWENQGYALSALYKTIDNYRSSVEKIKKDDFSIPNHYALLAYEAGKKEAYEEILALLPLSAK